MNQIKIDKRISPLSSDSVCCLKQKINQNPKVTNLHFPHRIQIHFDINQCHHIPFAESAIYSLLRIDYGRQLANCWQVYSHTNTASVASSPRERITNLSCKLFEMNLRRIASQ